MSNQHAHSERSAFESGPESMAELFHLVRSLVPAGQEVETASPNMTVAQAIRLMLKSNFSQLPVVEGNAVLGVFSFRSLARRLLRMERLPQDSSELPVDEFREQFHFVQPPDHWEEILDDLGRDDGVLVGDKESLEGILTPMDVLLYLSNIASPFVMLAEIEMSLRRIIQGCASEEELRSCIVTGLSSKYRPEELPRNLSDMTFNDYIQVIERSDTWPYFADAFGQGEWQRKETSSRLREIRDLRNDVFHFRRPLTEAEREILAERREWLRSKTRAFEAKKAAQRKAEVQQKAGAGERPLSGAARTHLETWTAVLSRFNEQRPGATDAKPTTRNYLALPVGASRAHLEWAVHGQSQAGRWLEVALHLEDAEKERNLRVLRWLQSRSEELQRRVGESLLFEEWGDRWARVYARRYGREQDPAIRDWAVETMVRLYDVMREWDLAAVLNASAFEAVGAENAPATQEKAAPTQEQEVKAPPAQKRITRQWDEPSFLEDLAVKRGAEEVAAARHILDWSRTKGLVIRWGRGKDSGIVSLSMKNKPAHSPFGLWSNGYVDVHIAYLKRFAPFNEERKRSEWVRRLNAIPGIRVSDTATGQFPGFSLSALTKAVALEDFLASVAWVLDEIEQASAGIHDQPTRED